MFKGTTRTSLYSGRSTKVELKSTLFLFQIRYKYRRNTKIVLIDFYKLFNITFLEKHKYIFLSNNLKIQCFFKKKCLHNLPHYLHGQYKTICFFPENKFVLI